jgi:hypothetical protein
MKLPKTEEEQPLRLSSEVDAEEYQAFPPARRCGFGWFKFYAVVLHFVLLIMVFILLLSHIRGKSTLPLEGATWCMHNQYPLVFDGLTESCIAPAQKVLEYEISDRHALQHQENTPYSGPPSTENDRAWDELLSRT